jgi:spore germination protein YaaH
MKPSAISGTNYFSVSYTIIGSIADQIGYVDRAAGGLDAISPQFFEIMPDASLKLASGFSLELVGQMHNRGIKVIPYLGNNWDQDLGRKCLANRVAFANQLATIINTYNIDGVDIDLENLTDADRADLVDFIRILRSVLPANKIIAVAVACNPTGETRGWHGSYDYAGLAQYADYLMMMTYEEHTQGDPEGPVASYNFIESSIVYALSKIAKNKLVLGIPFYGRYWKQEASYGGYALTNSEAEYLINNYESTVSWNAGTQTPVAQITIKENDWKPTVLYKTMSAGVYDVWFENEQSIRAKLSLVRKYGLKGAGSWALGYEPANMWDYYKDELGKTGAVTPPVGDVFKDIAGHWAYDYINYVYAKGWMTGVGDGLFAPNAEMTRAQAAALFVRALNLDNGTPVTDVAFSDITGHWAEKYIRIAAHNGIMLGVGDNTFDPEGVLSREQAAVLIERIIPKDASYVRPRIEYDDQTDIAEWAEEQTMRLTTYRIMVGVGENLFLPKTSLKRGEMAALIKRSMDYRTSKQ